MAANYTESEWENLKITFKRTGRDVWPKDHKVEPQWFHDRIVDFTLWYIFQGRGTLIDQHNQTHPLVPGTFLVMAPGVHYTIRQEKGQTTMGDNYIHVLFHKASGEPIPPEEWPMDSCIIEVVDVNYYDQITRRIVTLNHPISPRQNEPNFNNRIEAQMLFKALLLSLIRVKEEQAQNQRRGIGLHHEKKIREVLTALYDDPSRFRNVRQMAQTCGYSTGYFRTLFQAITGRNPNDVIIQARIERAQILLRRSDYSIGSIASMLGYENDYYFSRQFKAITGMPPRDYRSKC